MPLPAPEETCLTIDLDLAAFLALAIELPGGAVLSAKFEVGTFPDLASLSAKLLGELNASLTPLAPFFALLDVVLALIDCAKAVPDALGPPPDPSKLTKCVNKLLKASAKLLKLVPILSIPIMLVGVCKAILASLLGLRTQLAHMVEVQANLDLAHAKALAFAADPDLIAGAANLQASIDCASANLDLQMEVNAASMGPLNRLLDLIGAFASLAGLPAFAHIDISGTPAAALAPLDAAIAALNAVCASIPA